MFWKPPEPGREVAPDRVIDPWSGDAGVLRGTWPFDQIGPDEHEHGHHDGALYAHDHPSGRYPHEHVYDCGDPACDHSRRQLK